MKKSNEKEKEFYEQKIIEMLQRIENAAKLKRIYQLTEYLYIHEKKELK